MTNYIFVVVSFIFFNSTANAVMMAPWSRAAMPFSQVLEYLNENALTVVSLAHSKEGGSAINASVICPSRKSATLVFDVSHLVHGTEISLNTNLSGKCL